VFLVALGLLARGRTDNAAHIGGVIAGAAGAALWRKSHRPSVQATRAILGACVGVLVASIGLVAWRDATDPFATSTLEARFAFTKAAIADDRCADAHDGLRAVERLRGKMAPVSSLREEVAKNCGHSP
jgi:hypothetical protein